jgi:hypothetical protein
MPAHRLHASVADPFNCTQGGDAAAGVHLAVARSEPIDRDATRDYVMMISGQARLSG